MATTRTTNSFQATVPQLADSANIETAFNAYHDSIASTTTGVAVLNRANTFTANIAINNGTSTALTTTGTTAALFNTGATTLNIGGAATALSLGAATGTATVNNTLTLAAGTTSKAPLDFTSGTNTTNPVAGAFEYDGKVFYATPKVNNTTAGRGLVQTPHIYTISTDATVSTSSATSTGSGSGSTNDTDTFGIFGNKYIYLAASSSYLVEALIIVYHQITRTAFSGTVTGSINVNFVSPAGTTIIFDIAQSIDQASLTTSNSPTSSIYSSGAITIKSGLASPDTGFSMFRIKGILTTSTTAGNFGPTINTSVSVFNNNDGGTGDLNTASSTGTIKAGSYIKVMPLGGTGDLNIGGWA